MTATIAKANTEWIPQQIKVFSRWVESHLSEGKSNVQVQDITKDLSNGVALIKLAEILTHKEAPNNWSQHPTHIAQMVTNNDTAIDMFNKDGVEFVGISGKDIHDNKEKLVLGLVWTLILHYSIGKSIANDSKANSVINSSTFTSESTANSASSKTIKDTLMRWAIDRTENYSNINNFQPYDLSMCALLDSYVPQKINYSKLDLKDSKHNAELATNVMKELGIPVFLDSDDLQEKTVDEKALLTQLSTAKVVLEKLPQPTPVSQNQTPIIHTRDIDLDNEEDEEDQDEEHNEEAMREIEECMRRDQEENKNLPDKIVIDGQEFTNIRVREISLEPKIDEKESESETSEDENEVETANNSGINNENISEEFISHPVDGDNSQYAGRKFGLVMSLNVTDYNNGEKIDRENEELPSGDVLQLALTMDKDKKSYINPAGLKLTIADADIENDVFQQFTFGKNEWNTVIDSVEQQGMVWDVADDLNTDPPSGTPFYLFPFHGRHNQHFIYKDDMIYAQQNGQVVTFVGGDQPLVMMPPSHHLRARQTFTLQFI